MNIKNAYLIIFLLIITGCGSTINKNQYVMEVSPAKTAKASEPLNVILEVHPFTIDSKFSGRQMVYRLGEFKYAADYYNEFLIPPSSMITDIIRNRLADSGLFKSVTESGNSMLPTHSLSGSILACYADISNKSSPAAVLEVRLFLTKYDKGAETLIWQNLFHAKEPMKNTQAESFASAMSRCVEQICNLAEESIMKNFRNN